MNREKQITEIEMVSSCRREETLDEEVPEIGKWYWVQDDDEEDEEGDHWIGCVTHIGSNYVKLKGIDREAKFSCGNRIHFDKFWECCSYISDATPIIEDEVKKRQVRVNGLMREVKQLTGRLGVGPMRELTEVAPGGSETQALATREGEPMPEYRESLVKAKDETLPELFDKMKKEMEKMERWMTLEAIPLEAYRDTLNTTIEKVDRRILTVDLYAGLSEEAEQICDGEAAGLSEPIHLFQRRCYMDEECLAQYQTGGMEFKDLSAFDKWLVERDNRDRLLPFPRCIVAFRVRREMKEREVVNLRDYFEIADLRELDKLTFLYIRNGDQIWRINTRINFGEKLFPDIDKHLITGGDQIWAKKEYGDYKLISDNEYRAMKEDEERQQIDWDALPEEEKDEWEEPFRWGRESSGYFSFSKESVFYDDVAMGIREMIEDYNRVGVVVQGILDRSLVLHPHPPWKIWTDEGFKEGLRLVYDESKALVAGALPDFEAYRERLNKSLRVGSVTVGQQDAWIEHETEKECRRLDNDWRNRSDYRPERFQPHGDPGPGVLAKVTRRLPKAGKCSYRWTRKSRVYWKEGEYKATFTCPYSRILNVDAYKPGDFKIFFDDPRTRIQYLKWAPLLLEAEEYHAGNRDLE